MNLFTRQVPARTWLIIPLLALLLTACNLAATPSPAPSTAEPAPGEGRLVVTWVDSGNLMVWRSSEATPRRIASGAVVRPFLSPDGGHIAFTRGPQGNALSLWAADADGVAERELVGPEALAIDGDAAQVRRHIGQVAWLDARTVLFNTLLVPQFPAPGGSKADDLWRADAITGQAARLLPDGQGGDFAISPDGVWIALVTPGAYAGAPGLIRLTTARGEAVADLLRFDAASTASEYAFYPRPHWLPDSSALLVAIPDPDLVYPSQAGETPRTAALWRVDTAGVARQIGAVPASFFGLPRWSPDGAWMTYLEQVGAVTDNALALILARGDGSQPERIVTGSAGALEPPAWHPERAVFTYTSGAPGEVWLGSPDAPPTRFPAGGQPAFALIWVDATAAIYASAPGGPYELRLFDRDNTPALIAVVQGSFPAFDAVRAP